MILQPENYEMKTMMSSAYRRDLETRTHLIQDILDGSSIIRLPVTFRTLRLHADELVRGVVRVLRVRLPEDPSRRVQQAARLADRADA